MNPTCNTLGLAPNLSDHVKQKLEQGKYFPWNYCKFCKYCEMSVFLLVGNLSSPTYCPWVQATRYSLPTEIQVPEAELFLFFSLLPLSNQQAIMVLVLGKTSEKVLTYYSVTFITQRAFKCK